MFARSGCCSDCFISCEGRLDVDDWPSGGRCGAVGGAGGGESGGGERVERGEGSGALEEELRAVAQTWRKTEC